MNSLCKIAFIQGASFLSLPVIAQNKDSVKVEIINIGKEVNSTFADFAPVILADGSTMFFTSRRALTEKEIKKNRESAERVYISDIDPEKEGWKPASLLPEEVNEPFRNNSAIAISNDGQRMLLYRDDPNNGSGNIYESLLKGEQWSLPVKLPEPINSRHHESSASISPDGRTIYFVSDRRKGSGGRDIWYCSQDKEGNWGHAINLGYPVNTKEDEEGVFIHPDGKTLYFSSKGHSSLGGYDIFRSQFKDGEWSEPMNLNAPLNTTGDDVFFVMQANGTTGYYSSSKSGGFGENDIYQVKFIPIERESKHKGANLILLKGVISDWSNERPLEATIEIVDNEKEEELSLLVSNSTTGKYLLSLPAGKNYGITVRAEGYLFHSENFKISDTTSYLEVNKNIQLKPLEMGSKVALNNIFYDFNKATLRKESLSELKHLAELLNENTTMKIEISSHTDSKGSKEYNKKLSQERAQSVVDYLILGGVSKERLVATGMGESTPIATNDTEEGRQLNRRTEFTVLGK